MEVSDPYAAAKSNLRENVKWFATSMAGVAAAVLAGFPFSGIGALPAQSFRFALAVIGVFISAIMFFVMWRILMFTLRPDVVYSNILVDDISTVRFDSPTERAEALALNKEFKRRQRDLLPDGIQTIEEFEAEVNRLWSVADSSQKPTDLEKWNLYNSNLDTVHFWAAYVRLHDRVQHGMNRLYVYAPIALVGLTAFAWAANPAKRDEHGAAGDIVLSQRDAGVHPESSTTVIQLPPVSFGLGRSDVSVGGFEVVGRARDLLRQNTALGLLLLAHTDTTSEASINRDLAKRRAVAVRDLLLVQGSISPTRVFIAELPKADLEIVTPPQIATDRNRTVEFLFVTLPPRPNQLP